MTQSDSKDLPNVGLRAGVRLGKYEILERIGIGGQAVVYKGLDTVLNRPVAIKQIAAHLAGDRRFVERFRREAQILARLGGEHTHIVGVHELVENESGLFMIMEHVAGHTLKEVLERQRYAVPVAAAVEILWDVAKGLRSAHMAGIVHRDIKPGNVLVTRDRRAKILDFGVAAKAGGEDSLALGTTKYMAPELFGTGTTDARADIYSLGFIAYEMLTGREYFANLFDDVVRDAHTENLRWMKWHADPDRTAPALAEINPKVPARLSEVVAKMMAKDLAVRYATIDEAIVDLRGAVDGARPMRDGSIELERLAEQVAPDRLAVTPSADEVAQLAEPITAPIPKTPINTRKMILIGVAITLVAGVLGAALGLYLYVQRERLRAEARGQYDRAMSTHRQADDLYETGDVAGSRAGLQDALKSLDGVVQAYPDVAEVVADARAAALMCKGYLAMLDGQWEQADQFCRQAGESNFEPARDVERFKTNLSARQSCVTHLDAAAQAVLVKDFAEADKQLASYGQVHSPPADQVQRREQIGLRLTAAKKLAEFNRLLAGGDEARTSGDAKVTALDFAGAQSDFSQAESDYRKAQDTFDEKMGPGRLEQLQVSREELQKARAFMAVWEKYAEAEQAKDLRGQIAAMQQAVVVRRTEPLMAKLAETQAEEAYRRAEALRSAGGLENLRQAKAVLEESLGYVRSPRALDVMEALKVQLGRAELVDRGDRLVDAGRFDEGIEQYTQAAGMEEGRDVADKITAAKAKKHLAAGDAARKAKRWEEALVEYDKARQAAPDDKEVLAAAERGEGLVKGEQEYYEILDEGRKLAAAGEHKKARRKFAEAEQRAKDLTVPPDEATKLKQRAAYNWRMSSARAALATNDLNTALAHVKRARVHMDTLEAGKLLAEIEKAKEAEGE